MSDPGSPDSSAIAPSRAGRREWIGLAVIALPCLLYAMDLTVLNLALPALTTDLRPTSTQLLWIVDIYGFLAAGLLITMGTLGDRIGRRRLLMIGAAAFGAASMLAAFSTSAEMLIAARALLGVAGATLAPSTLALIRNMFHDPRQRTFAIGVWITSFSVGGAIGPLVGGALLEHFWWGSVFLLVVPVMAFLLVVAPRVLPEFRNPDAGRLDLSSAALSLAAVLLATYGLKDLAQDGWGWMPTLCVFAGLILGVVFVRRQRALADPLIDLGLFRGPAFSVALAANALAFFVAFGMLLFLAQFLQLVRGLSPLRAGLWTLPSAAGFIVGSMLAPVIVRRISPVTAMAGGLAFSAFGFGLLTQVSADSRFALAIVASVIFPLGLAQVFTLATDEIVGSTPPERAGSASAIAETSSEFGGAFGIAILGIIGTAVYRSQVVDAVPAGVSTQSAGAARDTLAGAVAVGGQLPAPSGSELVRGARDAFTQGLHTAAAVSAAAVLVAAAAVALFGRRVRISSDFEEQPDALASAGTIEGDTPRGPLRGPVALGGAS